VEDEQVELQTKPTGLRAAFMGFWPLRLIFKLNDGPARNARGYV